MMKTARTILLVAFVVLANVFTLSLVLPFVMLDGFPDFILTIGLGAGAVAVLISVACIVTAAASTGSLASRPDQQKGLGLQVFVCKLLMIPYFVVTTAYGIMMVFASSLLTISIHLASMGVLIGTMLIVLIPVMTVVNCLFLMATSSFAISNIVLKYRSRLITLGTAAVFVILQIFPIADVVSYGFIVRHFQTLEAKRRGW